MKTIVNVKTRLDKKGTKHPTVLSMDWTGCTVNDLMPSATDSLVITLQGRWRRAKQIPAKLEVNVKQLIASLGSRQETPITVEGVAAAAETMGAAERAALIAKLQELNKKAA